MPMLEGMPTDASAEADAIGSEAVTEATSDVSPPSPPSPPSGPKPPSCVMAVGIVALFAAGVV